jgi:hypothetical protein
MSKRSGLPSQTLPSRPWDYDGQNPDAVSADPFGAEESRYSEELDEDEIAFPQNALTPSDFIANIAKLLKISTGDPDFFNIATESIAELVKNRRLRSSNESLLQESIGMKDNRIRELESALEEDQIIRRKLEKDLAEKTLALRKMHKADSKQYTTGIEDRLAQIAQNRQNEMDSVINQIKQQGRLIHSALSGLDRKVTADEESETMRICQILESTNKLLAERLEQLREAHVTSESFVQTNTQIADRDWYRNDTLAPSVWMSKTREVLSLERQIAQVYRKLDSTTKSCEILVQENRRLQGDTETTLL